ncbi:hypothetical protein J4573_03875 [Actinomadura barringtoniae]|uniref:Secreted protein n=1 Tax=Actinomadura barringtoniae TaxID=1427535 RepID=A0A939T367_9ACTN|nr:hypothetical protein [Actinomadura barringtoniae]MBO2446214.1 hypothetical protein [Actinomadura barringtoniae]
MKSWRSLAAAGLIAGAAMATVSLTTGTAHADPGTWTVAAGGYPNLFACQVDGVDYVAHPENNGGYTQFACAPDNGHWTMWVK